MTRRQRLHAAMFAVVMVMLTAGGYALASQIGQPPATAVTRTLPGHTSVVTHTRTVKKVVRGRVVRLKSGVRVVRVPLVVIHDLRCHPTRRHRCVRRIVVPAHTIPLRAATTPGAPVAIAAPSVPITVYATVTEPAVTVTLPAVTTTQTKTETDTQFITVTVTVPVSP